MIRSHLLLVALLLAGCGGAEPSPRKGEEAHVAGGDSQIASPRSTPQPEVVADDRAPAEDQSEAQPTGEPTKEIASPLASLSTNELIDRLVEVATPGPGFHPHDNYYGVFIAEERPASLPEDDDEARDLPIPPVLRELVRRGVAVLPALMDHLSDARETQFSCGINSYRHATDYDPRVRILGRRRQSTFEADPETGAEARQPAGPDPYVVRVGDLCYAAIGQIVNRRLHPIHLEYNWFIFRCLDSPVTFPAVAEAVRKDWGGLTEAEHQESLTTDALDTTSYADWGAWRRLRFYYPTAAEEVAVKLLSRSLYNHDMLWTFIQDNLVKQEDERNWRPIIDDYVGRNGTAAGEMLPFWLYWIFFETDFARTPEFIEDGKTARKILARLYPQFDRRKTAFFNAADLEEQAAALRALAGFPSERIDDAVARLFEAALSLPIEGEEWRFHEFIAPCITRLMDTRHAEGCRAYCRKRIAEAEQELPRDRHKLAFWRSLMRVEPLDVPLSSAEQAAVDLLRQRGVYFDDLKEEVWFNRQPATDDDLRAIAPLERLTGLDIGGASVTDAGLARLKSLRNLTTLNLSYAENVTDAGLEHLASLVHLEALYLDATNISGAGLRRLHPLSALESLSLSKTSIDDEGLAYLPILPHLKNLTLSGTRLQGHGLAHLSQFPALSEVKLGAVPANPLLISEFESARPNVDVDCRWPCRFLTVDNDAVLETPWLRIVFRGLATDRAGLESAGELIVSGAESDSSHFGFTADGSIDYEEGASRIEFSGPARGLPGITVTYTAVLSENGSKLVCDGKTFRIADRPKTIVIDPDGEANEAEPQ